VASALRRPDYRPGRVFDVRNDVSAPGRRIVKRDGRVVRTCIFFFDQFCSSEHVLGGAEVSRVRLSGRGLIDLFAEDIAVTCVPGEFFDHGEQGPSHADCSFAGIVLGVVSDATSRRRALASDRPRAVAMSASRLRSSMFSMTVRSVPLVIRVVLMGFHSILLRR
jgi:hypothetical protein